MWPPGPGDSGAPPVRWPWRESPAMVPSHLQALQGQSSVHLHEQRVKRSTEDRSGTVMTGDFFLGSGKVLIMTFTTLKCTELYTTVIPQNTWANRKLFCFTHLIMSLGEKISPVSLCSSQEKEIT